MTSNISEFLNGNLVSKHSKFTNDEFEPSENDQNIVVASLVSLTIC